MHVRRPHRGFHFSSISELTHGREIRLPGRNVEQICRPRGSHGGLQRRRWKEHLGRRRLVLLDRTLVRDVQIVDRRVRGRRLRDRRSVYVPRYGPALHHLRLPERLELGEDPVDGAGADELVADLADDVLDDLEVDGGDVGRHFQRSGARRGEEEEGGLADGSEREDYSESSRIGEEDMGGNLGFGEISRVSSSEGGESGEIGRAHV